MRKDRRQPLPTRIVEKHTQEEYNGIVCKYYERYDYEEARRRANFKGFGADVLECQVAPTVSLDEMADLYGTADFLEDALTIDPSHYEGKVQAKVQTELDRKRKNAREQEEREERQYKQRCNATPTLHSKKRKHIMACLEGEW